MWNLNLERLRALAGPDLGELAIETGTCRGNGARLLAKNFSRVITIELSEGLSRAAEERIQAEGHQNVQFLRGSSPVRLREIFSSSSPAEPVFIFLDAHWSGDASVDWQKSSWKGYGLDTAHLGAGPRPKPEEQCPLLEELRAIAERCRGPAYVLVDDMHNLPILGPGLKDSAFAGENWSHLSRSALREVIAGRLEWLHELHQPDQWFFKLRACH